MLTQPLSCLCSACVLQYPDVNHGTVKGKPIREVLADSADWLDGEFITVVQQRGAAIIKVRFRHVPVSALVQVYLGRVSAGYNLLTCFKMVED